MINKSKWEKPKLVVLMRGRPGEVVLQMCKQHGYYGEVPGPIGEYGVCYSAQPLPGCGDYCHDLGTS